MSRDSIDRFPEFDPIDLWDLRQAYKYRGEDGAIGWLRSNIEVPFELKDDEKFDNSDYFDAALDHYLDTEQ